MDRLVLLRAESLCERQQMASFKGETSANEDACINLGATTLSRLIIYRSDLIISKIMDTFSFPNTNKIHVNTSDDSLVPRVFVCLRSLPFFSFFFFFFFASLIKPNGVFANLLTGSGSAAAANYSVSRHGGAEEQSSGNSGGF